MDQVPGGYDTSIAYVAIVIKHNHGIAGGVLGSGVEPRVLPQAHAITQADSNRLLSVQVTSEMKRYFTSFGCKWISQADPDAIELGKSPGQEFQGVRKRAMVRMRQIKILLAVTSGIQYTQ